MAVLAALVLTGCAGVGTVMEAYGNASGNSQLAGAGSSFKRSAEVQEFSEEEKVYTGRTVAANMLADARLSRRTDLEAYVNKVGQTLAQASGKASLPDGWHFILLASPETGAFSMPGGIILVDEGLVALCHDEDELAGVLAHEIAHVALDHPMQAISASNRKAAFLSLANAAYSQAAQGQQQLQDLSSQFQNVVGEVGEAVNHGYDRDKEAAADLEAVRITHEVGYDPRGLSRVLGRLKSGDRSHGDPLKRALAVDSACQRLDGLDTPLSARTVRFAVATR